MISHCAQFTFVTVCFMLCYMLLVTALFGTAMEHFEISYNTRTNLTKNLNQLYGLVNENIAAQDDQENRNGSTTSR